MDIPTTKDWRILTKQQQADKAGVVVRTIDRWEKEDPKLNEIAPPIKIGKRRQGRRSDQFGSYLQQR